MAKSKAKRNSLWPSTLKHIGGTDFGGFLRDQALDLRHLVDDAFEVSIETRIVESVIIYNFVIVLPKQDYRYQLFSLRTIGDDFPARVVAPHMPEPRQVVPVNSRDELEEELRDMFHDANTVRVVNRLASEARDDALKDRQ